MASVYIIELKITMGMVMNAYVMKVTMLSVKMNQFVLVSDFLTTLIWIIVVVWIS